MDAFAITGVSQDNDWFRVQAAVGGVDAPARLFPRIHVVRGDDIADLASGGRRIYFQQPGEEGPLVPLAADDATHFDPQHVPIEDIARFAFTESATDEDVEALLALQAGADVAPHLRDRLEDLGWVSSSAELTPVGRELLRHRLA